MDRPILVIGGGKMGAALIGGWLRQGTQPSTIHAVEPGADSRDGLRALGVQAVASAEALPPGLAPEVVLIAVKPQLMGEVLPAYRRFATADCLFVSIAAGRTLPGMANLLGEAARIVRTMPNLPASVGQAMTVLCAGRGVSDAQRARATRLMEAVGEAAWVDDEALLDPVTALSGSGPAYVFLLVEALAQAGVAAGIAPELAARLARQTIIGSGELLRQSSADAAALRRAVTSPGGTTEAALKVLMGDDGWQAAITRAVKAASARASELAG